jgi:hypothetical protein
LATGAWWRTTVRRSSFAKVEKHWAKLIGQSKVRRVGSRRGDHAIRKIAQVDIVNRKNPHRREQ